MMQQVTILKEKIDSMVNLILLTPHEAKIHDDIFINELDATLEDKKAGIVGHSKKWKLVREGLDYFREHNAEAYMVLLD